MYKIGIDVGGTFTDLVVVKDEGAPRYFKTPSTPQDPSAGVTAGLREVAADYMVSLDELLSSTDLVIHGTTVATNALIERKGAKVGLVTTEGFRDLLEMREGLKEDRYNLRMQQVEPLVPRYLRMGIPERVRSNGATATPINEAAIDQALEYFQNEGIEAIAVCFLFSYMNPEHEQRVGQKIRALFPKMYTSLSHQVLPQIKEFDRLSTTVVNSYVGPVLSEYLQRLKENLARFNRRQNILIMQSNGGVASIEDSIPQAVRSILSGPAGGVSGASYYGELLGEPNVIGFDMGGTSTDIALIDKGAPSVTTETFEGGWKIAVPMIDIQTLGAGGGSIARVDPGGVLRVGPESAGADPGPSSYGKGGISPTVTDANLVLGYLGSDNFLGGKAQLDEELAHRSIEEHVAAPLGLSVVAAAYGVHQLVSTTIAEGIRLMSVRRGTDARRFALLGFGGASGLQASSVARQLRIRKVYVPAPAPVLSAYGMLSTDLRNDLSRSFPSSLKGIDLEAVREILKEFEEQGRKRMSEQGVAAQDISVVTSADMRYRDQVYEVNVPLPGMRQKDAKILQEWASNFHRRYEELFSYHQVDQEIRLVTLRTSLLGRVPKIGLPERDVGGDLAQAKKGHRRIYLGGWHEVPVYESDRLSPGMEIKGPAILESDFTTILVEPNDSAVVDKYGGIELQVKIEDDAASDANHGQDNLNDPITLAIIEHRLESIALEMMEVMLRTSMSQILNSSRDYSTAILDADCQLVAQGEGIPIHISALPPAVAAIGEYYGEDINEGDLFIVNDPYYGGSHLPDITVILPIFYRGELLFYSVNRAHHSDIGGGTHGAYNPSASEIFHEGLRIPPLRLHERGVARHDILRMIAANVRHSNNFIGDLNAQIGSVMIAAQRVSSLIQEYGPERLTHYVDNILMATEKQVRGIIAEWPDGEYKGESLIDDDGFESKLIPIRANVTIAGDSMTIDLSDSSRQVTGFINSSYANTRSAAHATTMYLMPFDIPRNEGSMRAITVIAPNGLIVNCNPPAPVCMSTSHCAEEIVEAVFKALAPAVPQAVNSGFSRRLRYAITGIDPRFGRQFIWHFFFARGGGGASHGFDGWSNVGEITVAGGIRSPSVEVTEERFPFFVIRHELRPDSGGDGAWRGGLGGICEMIYEGLDAARLNTAGDGVVVPPFGLFGGRPGLPHTYSLVSDGVERILRSKETGVVVKPGDLIVCLSSGGGGYGDPKSRPRWLRDWDRKNGYVT